MAEENTKSDGDSSGFTINIGGNVGPGAVVSPNSWVQANNIAGRDIHIEGEVAGKTVEDFSGLLDDLRQLIEQARDKGELDTETAQQAMENIDTATELATQKSPPKKPLMRKLEDVSDLLDGAADTIESAGGVARVLLKAIPIAALLVKLASYIF